MRMGQKERAPGVVLAIRKTILNGSTLPKNRLRKDIEAKTEDVHFGLIGLKQIVPLLIAFTKSR